MCVYVTCTHAHTQKHTHLDEVEHGLRLFGPVVRVKLTLADESQGRVARDLEAVPQCWQIFSKVSMFTKYQITYGGLLRICCQGARRS